MKGQAAFVTGSSRGIGLGASLALARAGFAVALNSATDDDELRDAEETVRAEGGEVVAVPFDVRDIAAREAALDRAEAALGPLTTLVNNAGIGALERCDILEVGEASYDRCMATNAKGMFFLSQSFARRLLSRDRPAQLFHSIVNVTSSNAVATAVTRAEYCVSKAAAAMVSKSFAVRLGKEGIAVYDIQPGVISTSLTAPVIENYRRRIDDGLTLIPRVGRPEDIGAIVAGLASGALPYTTGHVISPDGGMLVQRY